MHSLHLTLRADLAELATTDQPVEKFLAELETPTFDEFEIYNLKLVIQELCANIVKHAYAGTPGTISLSLSVAREGKLVEVNTLDQGPHQFDATVWQAPQLEEPQEHGLGIWLMQQLMDEVHYRRINETNHWRLRKDMGFEMAVKSSAEVNVAD